MTREEVEGRWCSIIPTVFRAEHALNQSTNLAERLKKKEITPDDYIREIAVEIVNGTSDEQLAELE